MVVSLIQIVSCPDKSTIGIIKTISDVFEELGIDTRMLFGYCADTCNSMFGANHSVSTLLREKVPQILNVKCTCHMSHLCSHYASMELPKNMQRRRTWVLQSFFEESETTGNFFTIPKNCRNQKSRHIVTGHYTLAESRVCSKPYSRTVRSTPALFCRSLRN